MDTLDAIQKRKSVRTYSDKPITNEIIKKILSYGTFAPSPKNDQPWHFIVVSSEKKDKLASILYDSLIDKKIKNVKANIKRPDIELAFETVRIIRSAPVVVLVLLKDKVYTAHDDELKWALKSRDIECTHIQSIGAAIQNMLLAATDLGIGSVWLGDIFYAYNEIIDFIKSPYCLMAAVAFGYEDGYSSKKERECLENVCSWL